MSLRVTQDMLYKNSLNYLQLGLKRLNNAQVPLLTGKRINAASDDPFGTVRLLKLREEREGIKNNLSNISMITGQMESGSTALQALSNALIEARAFAVEGTSPALTPEDRASLAKEIDNLLLQAVDLANSKLGGRFLFAGTSAGSMPYVYDGSGTVSYLGNSLTSYCNISSSGRIAMNIPGSDIFGRMNRQTTLYEGNTGAAAGAGTDSGTANDTLRVEHTATTYEAGSGVSAGTDSAALDTILGPAGSHVLILDTAAGTVALDGGSPVSYDPASTNFMVTNEEGDRVYLDLTGPLASGTWDIASSGTLSTDGGTTSTAIDFSANQAVTDSATGAVTYVNASGIVRTGEEYLTYSGTFDLFQALAALRDDLQNTRGLSPEDQAASINRRIAEIDAVQENVLWGLAEFGGRLQRLDLTKNHLEEFDLHLVSITADLEEVDITSAIMALEQASTAFDLAQMVTTQILQTSVLGG